MWRGRTGRNAWTRPPSGAGWRKDGPNCICDPEHPCIGCRCRQRKRKGTGAPRVHRSLRGPADQDRAASFSFFSGRTFTFTVAGLAANHCSSPVNGLMPLRRGLAGTLTDVIFSRPGRVNRPAPFLLMEACTAASSEPSTARTSRAATPECSAMKETRPDLLRASLIGLTVAGLAAAFGAAFFFAAFLVLAISFPMLLVRGLPVRARGRCNVGQRRGAAKRFLPAFRPLRHVPAGFFP